MERKSCKHADLVYTNSVSTSKTCSSHMRNIERKHDPSHVNRFLVEVEPDKINNDESRYHSSAKLMIDNVRALI